MMLISIGGHFGPVPPMRGATARVQRRRCAECGKEMIASIGGDCLACHNAQDPRSSASRAPARPSPAALPTPRQTASDDARARERRQEAIWSAEFKAINEGKRLGKIHAGDPTRLARAIDAPVFYRRLASFQDSRRPNWRRDGLTNKLTREIIVASDYDFSGAPMTSSAQARLLAHELGHLLNLDQCEGLGEKHVDLFADAFIAEAPEPAFMAAARIQREGAERDRLRARLRAILG